MCVRQLWRTAGLGHLLAVRAHGCEGGKNAGSERGHMSGGRHARVVYRIPTPTANAGIRGSTPRASSVRNVPRNFVLERGARRARIAKRFALAKRLCASV